MLRSLLFTMMAITGSAVLSASPLYVSAGGRFASTDVPGLLVSPNANFALTFVIDSNPIPVAGSVTALGFDAPVSNFRYTLNGVDAPASPTEIRFNTLANGGLFDVIFGSGLGASEFSFAGSQAFTGTTSTPVFATGQYSIASWTFSSPSNYDFQTPTALAVAVMPTPEPSSLLLMACGVAGLGYFSVRRSPKAA